MAEDDDISPDGRSGVVTRVGRFEQVIVDYMEFRGHTNGSQAA